MIDALLQEVGRTKNKLWLCDAATYTLLGIMMLAGVIALPYSLWLVIFQDGSFSRILGALMLCAGAGYGVRWVDFFKKRIQYIDALRDLGFSAGDAIQAWNYYLLGKHDALSVELAKRTRRPAPSPARPRLAKPVKR